MSSKTRVSAHIAASTKRELDEYANGHGLKQGVVIEAALRHHLRALRELPAEVIIPPRLVVSRDSGERIEKPGKPTKALGDLFRKK